MSTCTPRQIVTEFYRAVREQDGEAISTLVERHFHEDATITWPRSLPYGGTLRGRSRVRKALEAAAGPGRVGPSSIALVALAADSVEVVAELRFEWRATAAANPVSTGAVEWWSFDDDDRVIEIRAYYGDTAALLD